METLIKNRPEAEPEPEISGHHGLFDQLQGIKNGCFDALGADCPWDDPWAKEELDFTNQAAEDLTEQTLRKVGQKMGPDGSGWYEQKFTGERIHLQFYDNPDQARIEFIANSIYEELGINVPAAELVEIGGQLGLATAEIPGCHLADCQQQRFSADIRDGFVADAYLANTDVIGINYDNVVSGSDGLYRSSAAGALTFAADGQPKEFAADQIPELQTMLDSRFTSGQIFYPTFDDEIAHQSRRLLSRLKPQTIEAIVAESGLNGPQADTVREGLVGRWQFLADRFGIAAGPEQKPNRDCRLGQTIDNLDSKEIKARAETSLSLRASESFLSDGDHIEAQTVDLIDARTDQARLELRFKLTAQHQQATIERLISQNRDQIRLGGIYYQSTGAERMTTHICSAAQLKHGDLNVKVAVEPSTEREILVDPDYEPSYKAMPLSAMGLVSIEIPCPPPADSQTKKTASEIERQLGLTFNLAEPDFAQIEGQLNEVMTGLLGIPGGLAEPTPEAERQHKLDCWAWHHKLDPAQLEPQQREAAENLQRVEVGPGCLAWVEAGKHQEYQKEYGQFAFFHRLYDPENLIPILSGGGLMASHKRYSLGMQLDGMSTMADFKTGGADKVFTRFIVDNRQPDAKELKEQQANFHENLDCFLVFDPALADRTDYYAYAKDKYGSAGEEDLKQRQSPAEMFAQQLDEGYRSDNEQMFADGISSRMFKRLAFKQQPEYRQELAEALMAKLLPDQDQRETAFNQGPADVQARLEQAYGLDDPVNSLCQAGPQALADFLAQNKIGEISRVGVAFRDQGLDADEWIESNQRLRLIKKLQQAGIEEINGWPVNQFVTEAGNHYDLIDLANDQPPRTKPDWPSPYQKIPGLYRQESPTDIDFDPT